MEVFLIAALLYWVAAPDPVTAGARTASGTAARAAGTGARGHWAAGRQQRQARRTTRRNRWWEAGGVRRAALRGEHAAVWTWGAAKTTAGVAAAAARPVPAAVKAGWTDGRERHRAKAGSRPVPVALDPPWWQPRPAPEQVQEQPGNSPEEQPLDTEEQIRARRTPAWNRLFPEPLTEAQRRFWTERDGGNTGPLDRDGRPGDPSLWPFKTDPDPTDATTEPTDPAPTEGDPMFTGIDTDLNDLTTVQDFALKVADMAEESDFAQLVEFCKNASDEVRDFGADMAGDVAEFEEVAAKIGDLLSELVDAATKVKDRGAELVGG